VIGLAASVHKYLGPGLLESVYEECLAFELAEAGFAFQRQLAIPIIYHNTLLEAGFRADIVVANELIVEIMSIEAIQRVHEAQVLSYLCLSKRKVGLLMNFNVLRLKDGLRRFVM
jgi:GxxExxY protein